MEKKRNYYTVNEARELIFDNKLSRSTFHKLIHQGEIPAVEFCRKKLIPAPWVEQKIKEAQTGANCGA